jgi:hypothetical protein
MAESDPSALTAELARRARDAAYVAVGLGVLGFQRLQVQRRELGRHLSGETALPGLDDKMTDLRAALAGGVHQLDRLLGATRSMVESALQPIEEALPAPAKELVDKGRELGTQLRQLVGSGR